MTHFFHVSKQQNRNYYKILIFGNILLIILLSSYHISNSNQQIIQNNRKVLQHFAEIKILKNHQFTKFTKFFQLKNFLI